jgi:pimeloyl-ACP methyl ester carboxylesterase
VNPSIFRLLRRAGWVLGFAFLGLVLVVVELRILAAARERLSAADAAPRSGRYVHAGDAEMFLQEEGPADGPAVLLIHGTGAWSEIWRGTMRSLGAAGYRAIALDMPPFGYTMVKKGASFSDQTQAQRILAALDALHLERVIFVGHSFGARATMQATFLAPSRVAALVLVDSALGLRAAPAQPSPLLRSVLEVGWLRNAIVASTVTNPWMTRRLLALLVAEESAVTAERVAMLQHPLVVAGTTERVGEWLLPFATTSESTMANDRSRYPGLAVPTPVLWGARDTVTPVDQGRDIVSLFPGAAWVELPQSGHIPAIEDPSAFDAALVKFLKERARASTDRP